MACIFTILQLHNFVILHIVCADILEMSFLYFSDNFMNCLVHGSVIVLLVDIIVSLLHKIHGFHQINQEGLSPSASHPALKHLTLVQTAVVLVLLAEDQSPPLYCDL